MAASPATGPVGERPGKIVCVGRNYTAHAEEMGGVVPDEPLIFLKPSTALVRGGGPIVLPPDVGRVDYEGEIAVVLGRALTRAGEEEAWDAVGWILPLNDVTARDLQRSDDQWTRAKGFDTFCPVGEPVPAAGFDPADLSVVTRLNGDVRQRGHTADLAFPIPFLLSWISGIMTLLPGDIVSTGTPEGVGPIVEGDRVDVEIPGVGSVASSVERSS